MLFLKALVVGAGAFVGTARATCPDHKYFVTNRLQENWYVRVRLPSGFDDICGAISLQDGARD